LVSATPPSVDIADQVKSLDWRARNARPNGAVAPDVLAEIRARVKALLLL
jgi:mRNA interferase MazF